MPFAQVVIGPPGSGKTTYCHGLKQLLPAIQRPCIHINLDPANDHVPYPADIHIQDLISVDDVMQEEQLGPNGALIYCMDYILEHFEWLRDQILALPDWQRSYFVLDCPGQVELQTHHLALQQLVHRLEQELAFRCCVVHLVDASHCTDASRFISVVLVSLQAMLHFELPHINVLSKMDLMTSFKEVDFQLEYYTQVQDLKYLLDRLNADTSTQRYRKLNEAVCELVEDFGLVSFYTLCVEDKESMLNVLRAVDKANGCVFGALLEEGNAGMLTCVDKVGYLEDVKRAQEVYVERQRTEAMNTDEEQRPSVFRAEVIERF